MLRVSATLAMLISLIGCSMLSTYAVAAREVNDPGGYGTYYCWARELIGPCASTEPNVALSECVAQLGAGHGHIHSRQRSRADLIECMRTQGWHRIEDFTLIH